MPSFTFETLDDAIKDLRSKGMLVSDPKDAKAYLEKFSVYTVINGYADVFRDPSNLPNFKEGSSFAELKALHHFDEGLRRCLTHYVFRIETIAKSRIIYQFCSAADSLGTPLRSPMDYLDPKQYDQSQSSRINELIHDLKGVVDNGRKNPGPIRDYHRLKQIPIWVLATGMTFGNTLKFYSFMKPNERDQIARLFGLHDDVFDSLLTILRDARNSLAHNNRAFCFRTVHRPKTIISSDGAEERVEKAATQKFGSVLFALEHLLPPKDFKALINEISTLCIGLSKKLKTITILDIATEMGIPNSMRLRYNLHLTSLH